ncbi:MAG: tetratricopeptide repeat protein, partial [Myxococcota bacterium]
PNGLSIRAYYEYLAFDFEAAKRTYERFTQLYPEEPAGWNNLALVYKRAGEYQKEEELYRVALGLSPEDDHALNNLAVCLAHQGRYDEALQIMERLEVLVPDDPYADLHRAKIYAAMGKEERAYRFLQKSLASMRKLDTLHNIEFRQDIRVDPAFEALREQDRFRKVLDRFYGERAEGWWNKRKGR